MKNKTEEKPAATGKTGAWAVFGCFAKISAVTIGGGYVMVPVIGRVMEAKGWVDEAEFYGLFATAQSLPGPIAFNTALVIGRKLAGFRGFCAAGLGILIPPFVSVLIVALLIDQIGENRLLQAFLEGSAAVVPGLAAALLWRMVAKRIWNPVRIVFSLLSALALILLPQWAVPLFFLAAGLSFLCDRAKDSPLESPGKTGSDGKSP